jgi:hypothetical protein
MNDGHDDFDRVKRKLGGLLSGMKDDHEFIGQAAAVAIIQTTLAGIGENDEPFAPYSASYKELIDSVGGKPRQVVDLRGLFYHQGQKRSRSKKDLGQGRRAFVTRAFAVFPQSGNDNRLVHFQAKTAETRPQRGLTDPLSEMSLDLVHVEATDNSLQVYYEPRANDYMLVHQQTRPWFSANKTAVRAAIYSAVETVIKARVQWAGDHLQSGPAPKPPRRPPSA